MTAMTHVLALTGDNLARGQWSLSVNKNIFFSHISFPSYATMFPDAD